MILSESQIGCHIGDKAFNNFSYADDLVVLAPSSRGLKMLLDLCQAYATEHDILFNTSKTFCMMIVPNNMRISCYPSVTLQDDLLQFVDKFSYLGHTLSNDMSSDADIEQQRRKLCVRGNALVRKFSFCDVQTKIQLFNSYCSTVYGSALWHNYTQENLRRLRECHNDILRFLMGVPRSHSASQLFVNLNLRSLDVLRRISVFSLKNRVENCNNELLLTLKQSDAHMTFRLHDEWHFRLYQFML